MSSSAISQRDLESSDHSIRDLPNDALIIRLIQTANHLSRWFTPIHAPTLLEFSPRRSEPSVKELLLRMRDTETLAHVTYKDLLKCDFETDRLLKGLEDPNGLAKTQKAINKMGLKAYIRAGEDLLSELRTKYNISDLEYRARSETGLWEGEVETLAKYAKTKASSDAVLAVLRACEN